jgi:hypothetical protein
MAQTQVNVEIGSHVAPGLRQSAEKKPKEIRLSISIILQRGRSFCGPQWSHEDYGRKNGQRFGSGHDRLPLFFWSVKLASCAQPGLLSIFIRWFPLARQRRNDPKPSGMHHFLRASCIFSGVVVVRWASDSARMLHLANMFSKVPPLNLEWRREVHKDGK